MMQLQRFKENAMTQFDALSNHELNRTFVKAMQGIMSTNKGLATATREDAETVMEDLQESVTQVKDLSDLLGQPMVNGMTSSDDITDDDLEMEFAQSTSAQIGTGEDDGVEILSVDDVDAIPHSAKISNPIASQSSRIEDLLVVPQMLGAH